MSISLLSIFFVKISQSPIKPNRAKIPIGAQLYGVRKECEVDFPGTVKKIVEMGYDGVELADYFGYSAAEIRKILDDNNLKCCGNHIFLETLQGDELQKTIEFNKTLGNEYLIIRWLDEKEYQTRDKWLELAQIMNSIAERLKLHGMRLGYHNHEFEFRTVDGELPWNIIADHTSQDIILELDTANCSHAGADPIHYLNRNPGRTATCHLKPYSRKNPHAMIGEDDIDWQNVFKICESTGGTEWYIVEYEVEEVPALDALRINLENLRRMGR
ncbi:sugar phosphate isomerase/epimerase [candidate division KSB1 bacterium]|nr:sugar phosphate isomerase/epimerase [candidate division KSB1 bacterium]